MSTQEAIREVKARLWAHLYEPRLFTDEPLLVWKAQYGLLAADARYLGLMLWPAGLMAVPMVLLCSRGWNAPPGAPRWRPAKRPSSPCR